MDERRTESGGLVATWRPTRDEARRIEVVRVCGASGGAAIGVTFAPGTDLADARERCPRWNPLWDKVQHEFWAGLSIRRGGRQ